VRLVTVEKAKEKFQTRAVARPEPSSAVSIEERNYKYLE
jgi:hypothetical protein